MLRKYAHVQKKRNTKKVYTFTIHPVSLVHPHFTAPMFCLTNFLCSIHTSSSQFLFLFCAALLSYSSISVTGTSGRSACRAALRLAQNNLCLAMSCGHSR